MAHRTATALAGTETLAAPPDIATMREVVRRLLGPSAPPAPDILEILTLQTVGHIELLIPEVQQLADRMPEDDIPRYCALACLGEARRKVCRDAAPGFSGALAHARRLARVLAALCDHFESLGKADPQQPTAPPTRERAES